LKENLCFFRVNEAKKQDIHFGGGARWPDSQQKNRKMSKTVKKEEEQR
jgi:hypothetical protein